MRWTTSVMCLALLIAPGRGAEPEPYEFKWETLLYATIKLDKKFDYTEHADGLMQALRPSVWASARDNEFQLTKERKATIAQVQESVEAFSLDRDILLHPSLELGKYDFDKKAFPVENMSATQYWYANANVGGSLPYSFHVYFTNRELLAWVPMDEEKAEAFIKRRTTKYGGVDRHVKASVQLRVVRLRDNGGELAGEIQSATVFEDANMTHTVFEVKKAVKTEEGDGTKKP
jgi:hypothetical protein